MAVASIQSVILTREPDDNSALAAMLEAAGFEVLQYPCIATSYLKSAAPTLSGYDVVAFMSRRAVRGAILNAGAEAFKGHRLAVVGEASAQELTADGLDVSVVANPPNAENLADRIRTMKEAHSRVLNVRGSIGLDTFSRICRSHGLEVSDWIVYENVAPQLKTLERSADYAVFASPSAAERFFAVNPQLSDKLRCVAIGPTTLAAIKKLDASEARMAQGVEAQDILKCLMEWRNGNEQQI